MSLPPVIRISITLQGREKDDNSLSPQSDSFVIYSHIYSSTEKRKAEGVENAYSSDKWLLSPSTALTL